MKFEIDFNAKIVFFLSFMLFWTNMVMAEDLHHFHPGDALMADHVNENFAILLQKINELSAKVVKLESNSETGDVKGCNWEGWKCLCTDNTSGYSGRVVIGMECINGVLTDFKPVNILIRSSTGEAAKCSDWDGECK